MQKRMLTEVVRWTGMPAGDIRTAPDGCGVVCFALPVEAMAVAYARLASEATRRRAARSLRDGRSGAAEIVDAMTSHPHAVAGSGRMCTKVMERTGGRVLAKVGAEGGVRSLRARGRPRDRAQGRGRSGAGRRIRTRVRTERTGRDRSQHGPRTLGSGGQEYARGVRRSVRRGVSRVTHESTGPDAPWTKDQERTLVRVAAATAARDATMLHSVCTHAKQAGLDRAVEEVLLQSVLFLGYPVAMTAMAAWREVAGPHAADGSARVGEAR